MEHRVTYFEEQAREFLDSLYSPEDGRAEPDCAEEGAALALQDITIEEIAAFGRLMFEKGARAKSEGESDE
jgi:hypothetical protein